MGVSASGATLEIQLVADVARLKSDMAQMQAVVQNATGGATRSFTNMSKGTGAAATQMALAAQNSARAAVGMGQSFDGLTGKMHLSRLEMRETFVAARELYSGSWTRLPGSLSLLGETFKEAGGTVSAFAVAMLSTLGIIKLVDNAELAQIATQKAAIAAAVERRAQQALSTVTARQAQVAIAQAQLAAAATAEAETVAQTGLVKAVRAVEVASERASIAQQALAVAQTEASAAAKAAKDAQSIALGPTAAILTGLAVAATGTALAFEAMKKSVADSGALVDYAHSLDLTAKQFDELKKKTDDFSLTFGDVWKGLKKTAADAFEQSSAWTRFKQGNEDAFKSALNSAVNFAATADGYVVGAYRTIVDQWKQLPTAFGEAFVSAVNAAIDALNSLVKHGVDLLNGFIDQANKLPFVSIGHAAVAPVEHIADKYGEAGRRAAKSFAQNVAEATAQARGTIERSLDVVWKNIIGAAEERIGKLAPNPPKGKKPNDHGLAEALAELDAAIRGQLRLAAAYLVSNAAAIKAEALQKAEEDAIRHKGEVGIFYEKELAKLVATGIAEGAKKVRQLEDETAIRQRVNAQVASGAVRYQDMNRAMQDEKDLQPLITLQSLAQGEAYKILTEVIKRYRAALAEAHREEDRSAALEYLGQENEKHQTALVLLAAEQRLVAANKDQRGEILKLLQLELDVRQKFPGLTEQEIQQQVALAAAEDDVRRHLDQLEAGYEALRQTGEQMLDTLFNIDNWKDPLDLALQLVKQLEQEFITLGFANPLKNKLFGENLPTLDSVGGVGGFFKGVAGQGSGAASAASLSAAGATLNTAGAALNTAGIDLTGAGTLWQGVALQIQAAAAQLAAAGAAGGGGGGLGGLGGILGLLGGGGAAAGGAAAGGDIALSGLYDDALSGLPGLATGGTIQLGGMSGTDTNVLSLNGNPLARVSKNETLAVGNGNQPGGNTYNIHVHAPSSGDPVRDRKTSLQQAADVRRAVARVSAKGLA